MRLVERDDELAALGDMLRHAAGGRGGVTVVSGGIGSGKTELLDVVREQATDAGFLTLRATGSWAERHSPGSVLGQLPRYAGALADESDVLAQALRRVGSIRSDADGGAFERWPLDPATTAALHQLSTEVVRISEQAPVLLCVDDIQYADALSLHWILQLVRVLRTSSIALVVAECTLSNSVHPHLHAELLRHPNYRRLDLGNLSPDGVTEVLADHTDAARAAGLGAECHRVTGGNPLLVRALVEDQRHSTTLSDTAPELVVGDGYADTVLSCLHRGRTPALQLAQVLAVLDGPDPGMQLATRLLEQEPAVVDQCGAALEEAGLIADGRLRHPVARAAVLRNLSPYLRRDLHRRAAELLYKDGASAVRIAPHLLGAEHDLESWAPAILREAAERYLAGNRAADAHACLDAALSASQDDGERVALKAQLAGTAWVLNPSISARHLGDLASALRDGRLPDRHALMLAKHLLWHGRFEEAVEAIERMGERADPDPSNDAEIRATRELLSSTYPPLVHSAVLAVPSAPGPAPVRRADGDARIRGAAALTRVLTGGPSTAAADDAEAAMRELRLGKNTQEWIMCAVAALQFADRFDAAGSWCDHWLAEARARNVPLWEAEFASMRAGILLRQGDLESARRLSETALAKVSAKSWGVCLGGPLANLVQAATEMGDFEAAEEYLEVPVLDGMFSTRFGLYFLHARGRFHLETGRPYAALDDFSACAELMRGWGFDQPALVPWRSESARAHLALGDRDRAHALAREEFLLLGPDRTRSRGITLRVLAATGDPADQVGRLTRAAEILQESGDRLQAAGALADLGRAHRETGRPSRARPVLELAARLAERSGAKPLTAAVACDLAEIGRRGVRAAGDRAERAAAVGRLSGAERRVAALAARGHTNREIAEKLCITVSTVEQHLTRVFRKIGVRARRELPAEIVLDMAE
ncbi:AAA family ATPase [Streptomyces pactum]|uniref:Helix-turn-helix transcriptional regulator n=1 Tax=Streptomyces pactum TaxID=68249 RepID=A0A143FSH9_9ACTN|nr:LuxR family transcriptional regulator [Streptomyces pactum]AMW64954.1 LuxR-type transcription factor SPA5613 [Streptomyces pactum]AQS66326.1 helix-turn-helix transcriptional regulator [Streptomyces pactum]